MAKATLIFIATIVTVLMSAQPVSAGALTSVVEDPLGDAVAEGGQAYQDIVRVEISKRDGVFVFVMELAAPVPASPVLSQGVKLEEWSWNLDTDPATFPKGFPTAHGNSIPPEFRVSLLWDGTSFTGIVMDRRPLLTGGEVIITSVRFDIRDTTVKVFADEALLDSPSSFTWRCRAEDWNKWGNMSFVVFDEAPNSDLDRAPWPA